MKIAPYFLALLLLAGVYSSCKKLDQLVSFNLDTKDSIKWIGLIDTVLTDTFPNNNGFILLSDEYKFSNNLKFSTNKTTPSEVESLSALNFVIELKDQRSTDLSFCKDLKIFLVLQKKYIISGNSLYSYISFHELYMLTVLINKTVK